jgi:hypothetical protein
MIKKLGWIEYIYIITVIKNLILPRLALTWLAWTWRYFERTNILTNPNQWITDARTVGLNNDWFHSKHNRYTIANKNFKIDRLIALF